MSELAVVVLANDDEQRQISSMLVDGTGIARTAQSLRDYPVGASDPLIRRVHDAKPDVVLVHIPSNDASAAIRAIELLHSENPKYGVFAVGSLSQPHNIVNAMRAGAREFLDWPTTSTQLVEAFARLISSQRKATAQGTRGKVNTIINAKGGSGATTIAVNTALALQSTTGSTALVDMAPLGHTALHLNLKPTFTVNDAIRNLHRLDSSLMEGYMSRHDCGLHVLAAGFEPLSLDSSISDFARLFDLLTAQYKQVVIDVSSRLDSTTKVISELSDMVMLVAQADVASLWSASKVQAYLSSGVSRDKIRLVLNRFRKIRGFDQDDVESTTNTKVLWHVPNQYEVVASSIDRGVPLSNQNHSEIARSFVGLATLLTNGESSPKGKSFSIFR
jgi:pilus assembly protein CpaE